MSTPFSGAVQQEEGSKMSEANEKKDEKNQFSRAAAAEGTVEDDISPEFRKKLARFDALNERLVARTLSERMTLGS